MKDRFHHMCDTDGCSKVSVWKELTKPDWNDNKNPEWCDECKVARQKHRPKVQFERLS